MRVKCFVVKSEIVEVEIPDEFQQLAQPCPWEDNTIPEDMYDRCAEAVEEATGIPFGAHAEDGEVRWPFIDTVWSAENEETMLED